MNYRINMRKYAGWRRIPFIEIENKHKEKDTTTGEILKPPFLRLTLINKSKDGYVDKEVLTFNEETTPINLRSMWTSYNNKMMRHKIKIAKNKGLMIEEIKRIMKEYGIKKSEI